MSRKKGLSRFETTTPMVLLTVPARLRACRLGWYLRSAIAFMTRARVEFLTTAAPFNTRETVAVDTPARSATACKLIADQRNAPAGGVGGPALLIVYSVAVAWRLCQSSANRLKW